MVEHPNFYENLQEAGKRLAGTYVMYDGLPYRVLSINDHRGDGIFRAYLTPLGDGCPEYVPDYDMYEYHSVDQGKYLDGWLERNPASGVLRKHLNSPKFNKFRPFPLGMCNYKGSAVFLERQPMRPRTEQGLVPSGVIEHAVSLAPPQGRRSGNQVGYQTNVKFNSDAFRDCVVGSHPSAKECVEGLLDPSVTNDSAAFDRRFALVKGPMDTLFIAYKSDVVGFLPNNDVSVVNLSKKFRYVKESLEELGQFGKVV